VGIAPSTSATANNPATAIKRRAMALTPSPYRGLSSREFNEDFDLSFNSISPESNLDAKRKT
jgi:hypothetical protein